MASKRNYAKMRTPIRLDEVLADPEVLGEVRRRANATNGAVTVWPSIHYGRDYVFTSGLVTGSRHDAAPGAAPMLTVLADDYFLTAEEYAELERMGLWP